MRKLLMNSSFQQPRPLGVIIAAAVVVVASFMPWITLSQSLPFGNMFPGSLPMNLSLPSPTAWNSNVTLLGITVPNWFLVGVAIGAAGTVWMSADSRWAAPRWLLLGLPIYGVCHSEFVVLMIMTSNGAGLGFGVILTFLAFGGMMYAVVKTPVIAQGELLARENAV